MSSLLDLNLCWMWESEVPIPVWILGFLAFANAAPATFISFSTDRVSPQTAAFLTILEISSTDLKSPGLETGNPASIISTPNWSSCSAMIYFCSVFSLHPGTCSPSRSVVSKIWTFVLDILQNIFSNCYTNLYFGVIKVINWVLNITMFNLIG